MVKVKRTDWNSIILAITIIVFLIIVILSTKVSAKSVEAGQLVENTSGSSEVMFEQLTEVEEKDVPVMTVTAGEALQSSFQGIAAPDRVINITAPPNIDIYRFEKTGYSTAKLNIRNRPDKLSEVFDYYYYNEEIHYSEYDNEWLVVDWHGNVGYVYRSYVSETPLAYTSKSVTNDTRKSFEDYRCLSKTSSQGLMQKSAITSPSGLRKVHNRYCVALGSYFSHNIGQYIDVVLANGTVIPCIIGDAKDDRDTSADNSLGVDGSCVEFIVDAPSLPEQVQLSGNCSGCKSDWDASVIEIRLYDYIMQL